MGGVRDVPVGPAHRLAQVSPDAMSQSNWNGHDSERLDNYKARPTRLFDPTETFFGRSPPRRKRTNGPFLYTRGLARSERAKPADTSGQTSARGLHVSQFSIKN